MNGYEILGLNNTNTFTNNFLLDYRSFNFTFVLAVNFKSIRKDVTDSRENELDKMESMA